MANEKKYNPGLGKAKSFFKKVFSEKPGSPKAKRKAAKAKASDVETGRSKSRINYNVEKDLPKSPTTFNEAFKQARLEGLDEFLFKGKKYASVTKEELGSKSLRAYLDEKRKAKKKS